MLVRTTLLAGHAMPRSADRNEPGTQPTAFKAITANKASNLCSFGSLLWPAGHNMTSYIFRIIRSESLLHSEFIFNFYLHISPCIAPQSNTMFNLYSRRSYINIHPQGNNKYNKIHCLENYLVTNSFHNSN